MKLNKKTIVSSSLLIVVSFYFLFSNYFESQTASVQKRTPAQVNDPETSTESPIEIHIDIDKEESYVISPPEIEKMIKSPNSPETFEQLKVNLNKLNDKNQKKIISYLSTKFYPVTNLRYTLRTLDIFQILFKKNPSLANSEIQVILEKLTKENIPPLVRGALRALASLDNPEALNLLADSINQEDYSLSVEVIGLLSSKIERHSEFYLKNQIDLKIIKQVQYLETHGQNTIEVGSTAIQALSQLKTKLAFDYLSAQLEKFDVNLNLKNEIAKSLPNWGNIALPQLKKYLQHLNSLEKEQNAMADQDRLTGIRITVNAIKQIQH